MLAAGSLYFFVVFAAGFLLGAVRVLWIGPALGPVAAVLIELPILLSFSWMVCGRIQRKWRIGSEGGADIGMGAVAFVLLMLAEAALSVLLNGPPVRAFWLRMATVEGAIGLAGQILFAALPAIRSRLASRWREPQ